MVTLLMHHRSRQCHPPSKIRGSCSSPLLLLRNHHHHHQQLETLLHSSHRILSLPFIPQLKNAPGSQHAPASFLQLQNNGDPTTVNLLDQIMASLQQILSPTINSSPPVVSDPSLLSLDQQQSQLMLSNFLGNPMMAMGAGTHPQHTTTTTTVDSTAPPATAGANLPQRPVRLELASTTKAAATAAAAAVSVNNDITTGSGIRSLGRCFASRLIGPSSR